MADISRRTFAKNAVAGATAAGVLIGTSKTSWAGANERVRAAVLGIRSRGEDHIKGLMSVKNVEVTTLCDVDENLFKSRVNQFFTSQGIKRPKTQVDLRRVMDDPDIDVVSIATPNHWHSLAAIWACQAGKDVYVEKPCSHNVWEGRQLVNAAKKHDRIVQHGTQIRSSKAIREAIDKLHNGVIGEVYMARGLCFKMRDSIGHKPDSKVPERVHYDTWLGPAPERPFSENRFHYNWHWHWDYGNGDIGNQGVHQMDVARWGLGVDLPSRVTSSSGMFLFDDDKEVPNTILTAFEYPKAGARGRMLTFDTRPWYTNAEGTAKIGILFYGEKGHMVIDKYDHYMIFLGEDEKPAEERKESGDHYQNFIDAVRAHDASLLHAPIEEGHKSSALCHIGLISAKLGRSLSFDPEKEKFINDAEADQLLTRAYREPFVVPEIT